MLAAAVAAEGQRAVVNDGFPEEFCGPGKLFIAAQLGNALKTDRFGHLGIGVFVVQGVSMFGHRVQQLPMRKAFGQLEVFIVAGDDADVGEYFVHTAVFLVQHALHLLVG